MNGPDAGNGDDPIPVLEEIATVSKRTVTTGITTVEKQVQSREHQVSEVLRRETASVETVPMGIAVDPDHPPVVRTENGVTIIPVLEEILVVEKRLVLKEELHIRHNVDEVLATQDVTLRSETVAVKHTEGPRTEAPKEPPATRSWPKPFE
ncbi:YsnF/AvaK domain-containing protein [Pseudomonas sp. R1-18]|uniref:YsnF/AvaK domain-containing protein n=1 Tax=Pseudomonas sp. R1-18 TaxID=1632772 RepID=UPI003DAA08D8